MAIYEDTPELLLPNVGDPLFGDLDRLELRSAFALDFDPDRDIPLPGEVGAPRIASSRDMAELVRGSNAPHPSYVLVVLNAKNRPLHVMSHELVDDAPGTLIRQVEEDSQAAMVAMLEMAILGGGLAMIVARYAAYNESATLLGDSMLFRLKRANNDHMLAVKLLDYMWIDPDVPGRSLSALDTGLL